MNPSAPSHSMATSNPLEPQAAPSVAADAIAIIGVGCRYPGGVRDLTSFWQLLQQKRSTLAAPPADRWDAERFYDARPDAPGHLYLREAAFLEDPIDRFDAEAFGISPREAAAMDPQQRVLLEVTVEALEHAGIAPRSLAGQRVGVYCGAMTLDYQGLMTRPTNSYLADAHSALGMTLGVIANRISHALDLRGPSLCIDTACSASLTALHYARRDLVDGDVTMAICGGVNLMLLPEFISALCRGRYLSPGGQCRPFEDAADGYGRGEGAGVVILKRAQEAMADGDPILGFVLASGVNQDGHTEGMSRPNVEAQKDLLLRVYQQAGISPTDVSHIEAHGTGTAIGDVVEAEALGHVFGQARPQGDPLLVGTLKNVIGHQEAGAGIAAVIKTLLTFHHGILPGHATLTTSNPEIDLRALNLVTSPWDEPLAPRPAGRVAGINAFGYGGTNAHVILAAPEYRSVIAPKSDTTPSDKTPSKTIPSESTPSKQASPNTTSDAALPNTSTEKPQVLMLAAESKAALKQEAIAHWQHMLQGSKAFSLADYTLAAATVRNVHVRYGDDTPKAYRLAIIASSLAEMADHLQTFTQQEFDVFETNESHLLSPNVSGHTHQKPFFTSRLSTHSNQEKGLPPNLIFVFGDARHDAQSVETHRSWITELRANEPVFAEAVSHLNDLFQHYLGLSPLENLSLAHPEIIQSLKEVGTYSLLVDWGLIPTKIIGYGLGEVMSAWAAGVLSLEEVVHLLGRRAGLAACKDIQPKQPHTPWCCSNGKTPVADTAYWEQLSVFEEGLPSLDDTGLRHALLQDDALVLGIGTPVLFSTALTSVQPLNPWTTAHASVTSNSTLSAVIAFAQLKAKLFLQGVPAKWQRVHSDGKRVAGALPVRTWANTQFFTESDASREQRLGRAAHPLLGDPVPGPLKQWRSMISAHRPAFLQGHQVRGRVVLPAAGYLEMLLAAAKSIWPDASSETTRLTSVEFLSPLTLEGDTPVELVTRVDENGCAVIESTLGPSHAGSAWRPHVKAKVLVLPRLQAENLSPKSYSNNPQVSVDNFYKRLADKGLQYSGLFQCIESLEIQNLEPVPLTQNRMAIARLTNIPSNTMTLHPSMLDSALQVAFSLLEEHDLTLLLPQSLQALTLLAIPSGSLKVQVQTRHLDSETPQVNASTMFEVDIHILDDLDNLMVRLEGLRCCASPSTSPGTTSLELFRPHWRPIADLASTQSAYVQPTQWLIGYGWSDQGRSSDTVSSTTGLQHAPAGSRSTCLGAIPKNWAETHPACVLLYFDPNSATDFSSHLDNALLLLRDIGLVGLELAHIEPHTDIELPNKRTRIVVATVETQNVVSGDRVLNPTDQGIWGAVRSLRLECPHLDFILVDLPSNPGHHTWKQVWSLAAEHAPLECAIRSGELFRRDLLPVEREDLDAMAAQLHMPSADKPVYWDTHEPVPVWRHYNVSHELDGPRATVEAVSPAPGFAGFFDALVRTRIPIQGETLWAVSGGEELLASHIPLKLLSLATPQSGLIKSPILHDLTYLPPPLTLLSRVEQALSTLPEGTVLVLDLPLGPTRQAIAHYCERRGYSPVLIARRDEPSSQWPVLIDRALTTLDALQTLMTKGARLLVIDQQQSWLAKTVVMDHVVDLRGITPTTLPINIKHFYCDPSLAAIGDTPAAIENALTAVDDTSPAITDISTATASRSSANAIDFKRQVAVDATPLCLFPNETPLWVRPTLEMFSHPTICSWQGAVFITGGLSGVGAELAIQLAKRGQRQFVLCGRRGHETPGLDQLMAKLSALNADVMIAAVDVCDAEALQQTWAQARTQFGQIHMVIHAAGWVLSTSLAHITREQVSQTWRAKVVGAQNMMAAIDTPQTTHFVMLGSLAGMAGNRQQLLYAAANAALEGLAMQWQQQGKLVLTLSPGALADAGTLAEDTALTERLRLAGITPLSIESLTDRLLLLTQLPGCTSIGFARVDWQRWGDRRDTRSPLFPLMGMTYAGTPDASNASTITVAKEVTSDHDERHAIEQLLTILRQAISEAVGIAPEALEPHKPLSSLGLDSLMALSIATDLEEMGGPACDPLDILSAHSMQALAGALTSRQTAIMN